MESCLAESVATGLDAMIPTGCQQENGLAKPVGERKQSGRSWRSGGSLKG